MIIIFSSLFDASRQLQEQTIDEGLILISENGAVGRYGAEVVMEIARRACQVTKKNAKIILDCGNNINSVLDAINTDVKAVIFN